MSATSRTRCWCKGAYQRTRNRRQASYAIADEPSLLVRALSRERGMGVLMTTHQPDHALLVADKVLLLARHNRWYGTVDEVLTDARLSEAYGARIAIIALQGDLRLVVGNGAVRDVVKYGSFNRAAKALFMSRSTP